MGNSKFKTLNSKQTQNNEFITISARETEKLGESFAKSFLKPKTYSLKPFILSLEGELGGGKTTFLKGFAKGLGIREKIKSPTFTIMRKYKLGFRRQALGFRYFYHFDCYRISKPKEILDLDFKEIIQNPQNIVAIEWGDKIKKIFPPKIIKIKFRFIGQNKRKITIANLY